MDPNQEIEDLDVVINDHEDDESVDDFIRELEEKEKDLHITLETTIIEIEQGFDDVNPAVYLHTSDAGLEPAPSVQKYEPDEAEMPPPLASQKEDEGESDAAIYELEEQIGDMEDQIAALKQTISRLETERSEIFKNSQRRAKDYEAFKARTERERSDTLQSQAGDLATQLLPALDNLDRALDHAAELGRKKSEEFGRFFEGISMVKQQVVEIFARMGIEVIPAVGEVFDPHLHEAVALEENSDHPENTVCEELLKGYRLGDRILRHSMVKVSSGGSSEAGETKPETEVEEEAAASSEETQNEDEETMEAASPDTELEETDA